MSQKNIIVSNDWLETHMVRSGEIELSYQAELLNWCEENCQDNYWKASIDCPYNKYDRVVIVFDSTEDAMRFKLVWA